MLVRPALAGAALPFAPLLLARVASARWSPAPGVTLPLRTAANAQRASAVVADENGGAFVA